MTTLGTYRVKIRVLFVDACPGRPQVPKMTSKSEVWGGILIPFWIKICVILCIGFVVYVYMSGLGLREGRGKGRGKLARKGKGKWKGTGKKRGKGKGKGGERGKKENWVPRRGRGCAARRNRRPLEMQGIASKAASVCWNY